MVDVFSKTYRSEGVSGLYRGYVATALGVMPYVGVLFFSYDSLKKAYSGVIQYCMYDLLYDVYVVCYIY